MSQSIKIDIDNLKNHVKRMKNDLESYRQGITSLKKECIDPLDKSWKSVDNRIYIDNINSYDKDLREFEKKVEKYIKILELTIKEYEDANDLVIKMISN